MGQLVARHASQRSGGLKVLLLGVTPEIASMSWPAGTQLHAIERSAEMIAVVWPGDIPSRRQAVQGEWLELPFEAHEFDLIIGDGCFISMSYPDGYRSLTASLRRVLKADGLVILRFFAKETPYESAPDVYASLHRGDIGSFHAFKWRLAMALQPSPEAGVRLHDIWRNWADAGIPASELSARTGWTEDAIHTIELYRDKQARFTFPSLGDALAALTPGFTVEEIRHLGYELGSRCPVVSLRPTPAQGELEEPERPPAAAQPGDAGDYEAETVHGRFYAHATREPGRMALTDAHGSMTYGELADRAEALAARLRARGVGPGMLVGLCGEPDAALIVGLLGILRAGGAYVPLDPAYPPDRLAFTIADSELRLIVGSPVARARLGGVLAGAEWIEAEAPATGLPHSRAAGPAPVGQPDDPAYVIYTSGSTGKPKGCVVSHRNVSRLFTTTEPWFGFGPSDVWTLFHSVAFDFSVWEIWGALAYGGRLVIPPPGTTRDPEAFGELLRCEQVTVLNQTPSAFRQLMVAEEQRRNGSGLSLRVVIFGGEALDPASLRPWLALHGADRPRLVNMYGITETTVHVTYRPLSAADILTGQGSVIGEPIPDLQLHVLDQQGRPAPLGEDGEIYVSGAGVSLGYLKRPELTAERFLPNPFGAGRLYRTGDLARRLPDGEVEYRGRIDHQVKIRGFRIELGEIESVLELQASVRQAVVTTQTPEGGSARLVAYVVPKAAGPSLSLPELRDFLRARLPEHMVPSVFTVLERMPLTPNGKTDRQVLPDPEFSRALVTKPYTAPRTELEQQLATIWQELLGLEAIGVGDHFFELGGNSLLAAQVIARVRRTLKCNPPLRALFEFPTVAQLATHLESAPPGPGAAELLSIGSGPPDRPLPASFAQEGLWFLNRLRPKAPAYNLPLAWRLEGSLQLGALERSLGELVRRHEALRTTFEIRDGQLVQIIHSPGAFLFPLDDLAAAGSPAREHRVTELAASSLEEPYDLAAGPLWRVRLWRLAPQEHLLLVCFHHIISDGWSLAVFQEEMSALYASFCTGTSARLPALPVRYGDYARWERERLRGANLERLVDFWQGQLAGLTTLALPTDRPRAATPTDMAAECTFLIPAELSWRLRAFNRQENVTPFMSLLAAFQTLLFRYADQEDIPVGVPVANRPVMETENLTGLFVNTLVLRGNLAGDPSFRELAVRVRRTALAAFEHQELPFDKLVERLNPVREPGRHPLFQVMFAMQDAPEHRLALPGLQVREEPLPRLSIHLDLELHLRQVGEGWAGTLVYDAHLFETDTIRRMAGHFLTLLQGVLAEPDRPVSTIPMLTEAERRQLLEEWSGVTADYPAQFCAHELFSQQAHQGPDRIAVEQGQHKLTYGELELRSNRLANRLREAAPTTAAVVAVCLERSPELVGTMLAILKSGAAYCLLDSRQPESRLRQIVADTGARLIVTMGDFASRFSGLSAQVVNLDSDASEILRQPADSPSGNVQPGDPAYVVFTSGSEGRPKGILVSHRALVNHTWGVIRRYDIIERDRRLQFAAVSSDVINAEVFPYLLSGATLVLPLAATLLSISEFLRFLAEERITAAGMTASYWHQWVQSLPEDPAVEWPDLRLVISGMEPADPALLAVWRAKVGSRIRWCNAYGPSETTITATVFEAAADFHSGGRGIPIGRPLPNVRVYVLDRRGQLLPVGVPGELYIGGDGVALGYLNQPELTADRFQPNPFGDSPTSRHYRTGDRARWLADGNLDLLGRADDQVKIRGYRVELGEVETVLLRQPGVFQAAVVARPGPGGTNELVAFIVPRPGRLAEVASLKENLGQLLPDYMTPSRVVSLEALPLNPNGKVDRKALSAVRVESPAATPEPDHEETLVEALIGEIWRRLFERERIGMDESFFDLGGHSLLSLRLLDEIRRLLGVELPPRLLFADPTIRGLTRQVLEARGRHPEGVSFPPDQPMIAFFPGGRRPPLFVFAGGYGDESELISTAWLSHRYLGPDQPVYALKNRAWRGAGPLRPNLAALAEDALADLRRIHPGGPWFLVGLCIGGNLAFEIARRLQQAGEAVPLLMLSDCQRPRTRAYWRMCLADPFRGRRQFLMNSLFLTFPRLRALLNRAGRRRLLAAGFGGAGNPQRTAKLAALRAAEREWTHYQEGEGYLRHLLTPPTGQFQGRIDLVLSDSLKSDPRVLSWRENASQGAEVLNLPGNHATYLIKGAEALADFCRRRIDAHLASPVATANGKP